MVDAAPTPGVSAAQDLGQGRPADRELLLGRLARSEHPLQLVTRPAQRARRGGVAVTLGPREDLDGGADRDELHRGAGQRRGALDHAAQKRSAGQVGGQQRGHEVRAAAIVLLGRVARVGCVLLIGSDRLVLDAVVGGQVAAAQCDQRRTQRERGQRRLAADPARTPPQRRAGQSGRAHRDGDGGVLEGQARLGQRALDERDHGHRLAQADHAAHPGNALATSAHARLGPRGDRDRAVGAADGRRPVGGPVHEQAVAQGHPAEAQLLRRVSHPSSSLVTSR
jgi:hypothetical protein